ncbi:hypothetical protein ZWY2020_050483 [Hordeum vulgare]|nr:hypothetical protein ZWY2020_050483 [Hordeum vulgare]
MVRFRVDEKGRWTVIRFVPVHNHQLAKPGERHLLRSAKSFAVGKSGVIDPAESAESHAMNGSSDRTVGDISEPPGYTTRDCYNHDNVQNITLIAAGDIQSLSQELEEARKIFWDSLETGEKALEVFFEMRSLHAQSAKDASKGEKKKKKISKGPSAKKAKQALASSSAPPVLIAQTTEQQFQPAQDPHGNGTIGRSYYYQVFPSPMQPNQIFMHPNTMPVCAPQDLSAYAAVRPNSNFGGAKNI